MDGQLLQSKIWKGYGKAAQHIGSLCNFFRPAAGTTPTVWTDPTTHVLNNLISSMQVSLNAEDMKYGKPNKYGKSTWYALVDATNLQRGDYFVGSQGTFFIADLQLNLPILVVECNRTVTISRVAPQTTVGAGSYGGMTTANETAYITGAPCSILQGTKGEKSDVGLPADVRTPWWAILIPAAVGNVLYGDLMIDDLGKRYVISSVELTDLGYRITATQATT